MFSKNRSKYAVPTFKTDDAGWHLFYNNIELNEALREAMWQTHSNKVGYLPRFYPYSSFWMDK